MSSEAVRLLYVTVPSAEVASQIADALVAGRLAACVNVIPGMTSVYRWQGEVCSDTEWVLLVKTTASAAPAAQRVIVEAHPAELPCVLEIAPSGGHAPFLGWIAEQVDVATP